MESKIYRDLPGAGKPTEHVASQTEADDAELAHVRDISCIASDAMTGRKQTSIVQIKDSLRPQRSSGAWKGPQIGDCRDHAAKIHLYHLQHILFSTFQVHCPRASKQGQGSRAAKHCAWRIGSAGTVALSRAITSMLWMYSGMRSTSSLRWMCACMRCLKAALRSRSKPARARHMFTAASMGTLGRWAAALACGLRLRPLWLTRLLPVSAAEMEHTSLSTLCTISSPHKAVVIPQDQECMRQRADQRHETGKRTWL